jgi:macrolide phosphotransferase
MRGSTSYGGRVTRSDLALAGLACAAVPGMKPVSVQELHRGPEAEPAGHQTALVEDSTGRRWLVVAPLTAAAAADLERNDVLVRQLGRHLPFKVPVATGYATAGDHGRAAVFPYVEGANLNLHTLPAGPGLASAIGRAVAAVHNISAGLFEEFGVPVFDAAAHRERRLSELDRAAETGRVPTGLLARWEQAFEAPALWHFASTPVHGSLDGWAFRVAFSENDASTGRVVALTNWGQASVTDPAEDFALLVQQATPAAVDSVLESYALARSQRPDPHLLTRARLASEMRLIRGLAAAVGAGDEETVRDRVDQLRKLDRLTSADDSLVPAAPAEHVVETSPANDAEEPEEEVDRAEPEQEVDPEEPEQEVDPEEDVPAPGSPVGAETQPDTVDPGTGQPSAHEPVPGPLEADEDSPSDPTETLPVVRLGEGLDERTRLQDLYGMPEDVLHDLPAQDPDRSAAHSAAEESPAPSEVSGSTDAQETSPLHEGRAEAPPDSEPTEGDDGSADASEAPPDARPDGAAPPPSR